MKTSSIDFKEKVILWHAVLLGPPLVWQAITAGDQRELQQALTTLLAGMASIAYNVDLWVSGIRSDSPLFWVGSYKPTPAVNCMAVVTGLLLNIMTCVFMIWTLFW